MAFQVSVYLVMVIDLGNSSSRKTSISQIISKVSHVGGGWEGGLERCWVATVIRIYWNHVVS